MYESHFGFSGSPFQLNPDPAFYFDSRGHSNALAYLKFGAHQGEGFIVVTGEIGAGKTTLVRTLLEGLNPEQVVAAQVVSTQLESSELLQAILMAFGIPSGNTSKAHLIANLEGYFTALAAKGRRALLIIDEAQNLKHEAVEELRMLSNFQLGKYGLLQSFLVGQPELRALLQSKSMEQLRQRVIASCHLGPLDQAETRAYVEHRLRRVGWKGTSPQFETGALDRIHYWTGGVPRKINRLCNRMLLGAFLTNTSSIAISLVDETANELRNEIGDGQIVSIPLATTPAETADAAAIRAVAISGAAPAPMPASVLTAAAPGALPLAAADAPAAPAAATPQAENEVAGPLAPAPVAPTPPVAPPVPTVAQVQGAAPADAAVARGDEAAVVESISRRDPVARRAHRAELSSAPLLCLVDSPTHYLMAGALQAVFQQFPSLPSVVAVNVGIESNVWSAGFDATGIAMPALGLHLGMDLDNFSGRTVGAIAALNAVFDEFNPGAVLVLGSSEEALAGALLANKRNLRVLRVGSGQRDLHERSAHLLNAVLIERIADLHFTDSSASFYALYREGIHLDRVRSVGNLAREAFDQADPAQRAASAALRSLQARATGSTKGFGLIDMGVELADPDEPAFARLVTTLCEIGAHLPLVWLADEPARERLLNSKHVGALRAATIDLVSNEGFLSSLAWLRHSRCLITGSDGALLGDAMSLGVPALRLQTNGEAMAPAAARLAPGGNKALEHQPVPLQRLLFERATIEEAPDYWHNGTASRIAAHLVAWLPGQSVNATTGSQDGAPEVVVEDASPYATGHVQLADSP